MLKVLELFSGVGSFSIKLKNMNIDHEIVGYSDIRKSAVELFCKIHGTKIQDNLGDITSINAKGLQADLICFGSPCQSFTREGKGDGAKRGGDSKSSLMWYAVDIMKEVRPKFIIWENVSDAVNKKHFGNFKNYIEELDEMGYNTYYEVLNAYELGGTTKRKRLFSISIRKDIDNNNFKFKYEKRDHNPLINYLDLEVDSKYILPEKIKKEMILGEANGNYVIKNGTKDGWCYAKEGDGIDFGFYTSKTRRGRVQDSACQTLLRSQTIGTIQNGVARYLTPLEYWRIQEMPSNLWKYVEDCNYSNSEAYDVVGGVINQLHLEVVFNSLRVAYPEYFGGEEN